MQNVSEFRLALCLLHLLGCFPDYFDGYCSEFASDVIFEAVQSEVSARKVVELLALVVVHAEEVIQGVCILVSKGMVASHFRGVDYHRCRLEVCQRFSTCSSRSDCKVYVAVATEVGIIEEEVGGKDKTALRQSFEPCFSFVLFDPSAKFQVPEIECFQERGYVYPRQQ